MDGTDTYGMRQHVSLPRGLAYSMPTVAVYFLYGSLAILQGIYAKNFGMELTTIATVIFIARLFDGITDPIIGYFSDQHFHKTGSRKTFVVCGGLLFVLSSYFLFIPPDNVSATYFLGWFLVFYLGYTLFGIPHLAWGAELTDDSGERNKIYGLRTLGVYVGTLLFFSLPLLPIFETDEYTPQVLRFCVVIAVILILPMLYFCIKIVPDGQNPQSCRNDKQNKKLSWSLLSIVKNKPFLFFVTAFFFTGIGIGMWFALLFIFVDTYLGLGSKLSIVYVVSLSISTLALGGWCKLANRLGKKAVWGLGVLMMVVGIIGTGLLMPDDTNWVPLLFCATFVYCGSGALSIMAPSLLSDIIDYGTWKTGINRAASYFSIYNLITKANLAIGGAIGLGIAGWCGFNPAISIHSEEAIFGIRLAISWLPALVVLLSLIFISMIPINRKRHRIIRRRLDARLAVKSINVEINSKEVYG